MKTTQSHSVPSDQALLNETGKNWSQWFGELYSKGFESRAKKDQVLMLVDQYDVDEEWAKLIIDQFTLEHNLPVDLKPLKGFEVSICKTVHYPLGKVLDRTREWFENEQRAVFREQCNGSKIKYQWSTDNSQVAIKLESKGVRKTKMIVRHEHLHSLTDADSMRNFWKEHMKGMVETL